METYGHDPVKRSRRGMYSRYMRAYIDVAVSLPAGRLVKFIVYSHHRTGKIGLVLGPRFFGLVIIIIIIIIFCRQ